MASSKPGIGYYCVWLLGSRHVAMILWLKIDQFPRFFQPPAWQGRICVATARCNLQPCQWGEASHEYCMVGNATKTGGVPKDPLQVLDEFCIVLFTQVMMDWHKKTTINSCEPRGHADQWSKVRDCCSATSENMWLLSRSISHLYPAPYTQCVYGTTSVLPRWLPGCLPFPKMLCCYLDPFGNLTLCNGNSSMIYQLKWWFSIAGQLGSSGGCWKPWPNPIRRWFLCHFMLS